VPGRCFPRRVRNVTLALLVVLAATFAAAGQAQGAVTATGIRIGDHPAFVRVVVDFSGGRISDGNVFATDPSPFADGKAAVRVGKRGIRAGVRVRTRYGVRARLQQGTNRIVLRITTGPRRFKYLAYVVYRGPQRLVVDLWKSRPPVAGASFTTAPMAGCLTLDAWSVGAGTVWAAGRERDLFEHMFQIGVRKANGRIARRVPVTAFAGHWSRSFRYSASRPQAGTLEVVDLSEKDGALACIAQVRVLLLPPP
jgi:Immunoglobulin-like domain of bacterial spore germination